MSRMLGDSIRERACLMDFLITRFWNMVPSFDVSTCKILQKILSHMASLDCFVPIGRDNMHSLQWQLKSQWVALIDNLINISPFFGRVSVLHQMMAAEGGVGIWCPSRSAPPVSPSVHRHVTDWLESASLGF